VLAAATAAIAVAGGRGNAPSAAAADVYRVVAEMNRELTKKNGDPGGRPLPVVSHWANGFNRPKFSSDYQIGLLAQGHRVMPTIPFPRPGAAEYPREGKPWIEKLARWKAPISLRAGQWESVLYDKDHPREEPGRWRNLPPEKSPLLINPQGKLENWLSPFGAVEPWYEAGRYNTSSGAFAQLQQSYPDPPLVILLSNNEARKIKTKHNIELRSKRYVDRHAAVGGYGIRAYPPPRGNSGFFQRRAIAEGYLPRYAALLRGIRDGLGSKTWRENSLLVGYGAFGPPHFGRWDEWTVYSLTTEDRIDPWHLVWEGGSPSYYTHNWNASTDYRVHSPQIESMNWVFMLEEAYAERPDFWFEISVWDGNTTDKTKPGARKKGFYLREGQEWSPERYAGFVQFGLWLLRPRVVREFRGSTMPRDEFGRDFEALVEAVDRVWQDPVLTRFWRHGQLVPNRSRKHPYQSKIPEKWRDIDRFFLLNTSLDPPEPWQLDTEIPVFSLARRIGEGPNRQWLLYAHAPVKTRQQVRIEIPEFGQVTVDVTPGGNFYLIKASDRSATPVATLSRPRTRNRKRKAPAIDTMGIPPNAFCVCSQRLASCRRHPRPTTIQ
jgi:hypothetical protein